MTRRTTHRPLPPTRYGWALRRGPATIAEAFPEWDTAAEARDALRDAFFALEDRTDVAALITLSSSPQEQRATFAATAPTWS